jgi:hypothetical protein
VLPKSLRRTHRDQVFEARAKEMINWGGAGREEEYKKSPSVK